MHSELHHDIYDSVTSLPCAEGLSSGLGSLPLNLHLASTPEDLVAIRAPEKNIAIYGWTPNTQLRDRIASQNIQCLTTGQWRVPRSEPHSLLRLIDDQDVTALIVGLLPSIVAFAELVEGTHLELNIENTREQPCPLFHVDRLTYRMLCTFRGPGTQWLDDRYVHRRFLGKGSNQRIVRYGATVYEVDRFDVCILKGESVKGGYRRGIVHRSPPVSHCDEARWYLRVDAK